MNNLSHENIEIYLVFVGLIHLWCEMPNRHNAAMHFYYINDTMFDNAALNFQTIGSLTNNLKA